MPTSTTTVRNFLRNFKEISVWLSSFFFSLLLHIDSTAYNNGKKRSQKKFPGKKFLEKFFFEDTDADDYFATNDCNTKNFKKFLEKLFS